MKVYLLSAFFIICWQLGYGQNDLIIFESDTEFQGRLSVKADTNSIFIGDGAGSSVVKEFATMNTFIGASAGRDNTNGAFNTFLGGFSGLSTSTGLGNVMLGFQTGQFNEVGNYNAFVGYNAGFSNNSGDNNAYLGNSAGLKNTEGNSNTFLGAFTGFENLTGSGNLFLGYQAGQLELGSNKLYIANSAAVDPLIYGEFDNHKVKLNASLHITEFVKLDPTTAPSTPDKGTVYYDEADNKLKVWTGAAWENLN